uniref:Uncharacterized protein n=1 Tax=Prolemur simus TaxID=1328070 RepID=A0A8C8ZYW8_PROSS
MLPRLDSNNPPVSASQSARITGMSHRARPRTNLFNKGICSSPAFLIVPSVVLAAAGLQGHLESLCACQQQGLGPAQRFCSGW